nr:30S ribosomal protein S8 [uncultured archaeon]
MQFVKMSQDNVSDALNNIMNAKKADKDFVIIKRHSKLLLSVLAIAKLKGYVKNYKMEKNILTIELGNISGCKAIKPRFVVSVNKIEKYTKRYLPAKNIGILIVSTSQGLMTHQTAQDKKIGGSLIAYLF